MLFEHKLKLTQELGQIKYNVIEIKSMLRSGIVTKYPSFTQTIYVTMYTSMLRNLFHSSTLSLNWHTIHTLGWLIKNSRKHIPLDLQRHSLVIYL